MWGINLYIWNNTNENLHRHFGTIRLWKWLFVILWVKTSQLLSTYIFTWLEPFIKTVWVFSECLKANSLPVLPVNLKALTFIFLHLWNWGKFKLWWKVGSQVLISAVQVIIINVISLRTSIIFSVWWWGAGRTRTETALFFLNLRFDHFLNLSCR